MNRTFIKICLLILVRISEFGLFMGGLHNALVYKPIESKGSLSVLHNATVQYDPLRTLVIDLFMHVGVMEKPS